VTSLPPTKTRFLRVNLTSSWRKAKTPSVGWVTASFLTSRWLEFLFSFSASFRVRTCLWSMTTPAGQLSKEWVTSCTLSATWVALSLVAWPLNWAPTKFRLGVSPALLATWPILECKRVDQRQINSICALMTQVLTLATYARATVQKSQTSSKTSSLNVKARRSAYSTDCTRSYRLAHPTQKMMSVLFRNTITSTFSTPASVARGTWDQTIPVSESLLHLNLQHAIPFCNSKLFERKHCHWKEWVGLADGHCQRLHHRAEAEWGTSKQHEKRDWTAQLQAWPAYGIKNEVYFGPRNWTNYEGSFWLWLQSWWH